MSDYVKRAKAAVQEVMREFEPAKNHAVGAGREMLLALRSVVDAEINLLERATTKKPAKPEPLEESADPECGCDGPKVVE